VRTAIDSNIISALWSVEPLAREVMNVLRNARAEGGLVVSGPVYAELCAHPNVTAKFVEEFLTKTGIEIDFDIGPTMWRETATRFAKYAARRRSSRGGAAKRLLVDFVVGAHASLSADRLLTLDIGRYHRDFPDLTILAID
jgi:predicted nucleic acid-binding protein